MTYKIKPPFDLVQRGPGYYLTDARGYNIACMTANKADARFVLQACNFFAEALQMWREVKTKSEETGAGMSGMLLDEGFVDWLDDELYIIEESM